MHPFLVCGGVCVSGAYMLACVCVWCMSMCLKAWRSPKLQASQKKMTQAHIC